jgi:hypothetical protein
MIHFLLFTFLLFCGFGIRSYVINNTASSENRQFVSNIYTINLIAIYLTFIFSDNFYIMNYLGWISTVILISGYIRDYVP